MIAEAYECLSDPNKRSLYDRGNMRCTFCSFCVATSSQSCRAATVAPKAVATATAVQRQPKPQLKPIAMQLPIQGEHKLQSYEAGS